MTRIRFIIEGNHKDIGGNPIPYKRLIRGHFRDGDADYLAYGHYVRARFSRTAVIEGDAGDLRIARDGREVLAVIEHDARLDLEAKPIGVTKRLMQLDLKIQFANGAHGDPDNIFKAIADALFVNDKNLYGTFPIPELPRAPDGRGRVEALLTITNIKA